MREKERGREGGRERELCGSGHSKCKRVEILKKEDLNFSASSQGPV